MTYTSNGPTKLMVIGTTYTAEGKVIAEVAPVYNLMLVSHHYHFVVHSYVCVPHTMHVMNNMNKPNYLRSLLQLNRFMD